MTTIRIYILHINSNSCQRISLNCRLVKNGKTSAFISLSSFLHKNRSCRGDSSVIVTAPTVKNDAVSFTDKSLMLFSFYTWIGYKIGPGLLQVIYPFPVLKDKH